MIRLIIQSIRLYLNRNGKFYGLSISQIGFVPNNKSLYRLALLHKSASKMTSKGVVLNYERLEFLGDAILDAVVADIVYKKFEGKREGFLTNTRSKIVQRETLNRLAIEIGLDKLIKYSARQSSHNSYMCGNAFEALVGAIYLDRGYRACKHFMEHRIIGPYINLEKISRKEVNFKSKLIEWSQKNRVELTFELITQSHDQCFSPTFVSEVLIEGIPAGRGIGYSKKESQQRAAHEAMGKIKDSAFMESVLAAKSVREAPQEEVMLPREEAVETVISAVSEEIGISELNEQIISEAEEMAFKEVK